MALCIHLLNMIFNSIIDILSNYLSCLSRFGDYVCSRYSSIEHALGNIWISITIYLMMTIIFFLFFPPFIVNSSAFWIVQNTQEPFNKRLTGKNKTSRFSSSQLIKQRSNHSNRDILIEPFGLEWLFCGVVVVVVVQTCFNINTSNMTTLISFWFELFASSLLFMLLFERIH